MNLQKLKKLSRKFGVNLASESPIAKQNNLYGGHIAFQLMGETVIHCLYCPKHRLYSLRPKRITWYSGDHIDAIATALTGTVPPKELINTLRKIEALID